MSHNLSISVKRWVLSFKKQNNEESRKPEYLTDQKAESVRRFLHDKNARYIDLTDDNGNLKETIEKKEIESLKLITDSGQERGTRSWVCDYGTRHPMSQGVFKDFDGKTQWKAQCDCPQRFGEHEPYYRYIVNRYKVNSTSDITEKMQMDFLNAIEAKKVAERMVGN